MSKMSASYEHKNIDGVNVTVDISLLAKTKEMAINCSPIATAFDKDVESFLRLGSTVKYIQAIMMDEDTPLNKISDFVQYRKGKYPGTYLLDELAFEFAGFCSNLFRRNLHKWAVKRIKEEEDRIKEEKEEWMKYNKNKKYSPPKRYFEELPQGKLHAHDPVAFSNRSGDEDMINKIILGEQFKILTNKYGKKNIRACMNSAQLSMVKELRIMNTGVMLTDMEYEERKYFLSEIYQAGLSFIGVID